LEHFEEPDRFIFSMEKIPNSCTLFELVMESPPLANTELLRHIFRELININITLQTYGVWHRDCKPENILYCKNDRSLRFIDFGSAAPAQSEDFREFQVCFSLVFEILISIFFFEGYIRNYGT
jgi:serine/threonine protein kinase